MRGESQKKHYNDTKPWHYKSEPFSRNEHQKYSDDIVHGQHFYKKRKVQRPYERKFDHKEGDRSPSRPLYKHDEHNSIPYQKRRLESRETHGHSPKYSNSRTQERDHGSSPRTNNLRNYRSYSPEGRRVHRGNRHYQTGETTGRNDYYNRNYRHKYHYNRNESYRGYNNGSQKEDYKIDRQSDQGSYREISDLKHNSKTHFVRRDTENGHLDIGQQSPVNQWNQDRKHEFQSFHRRKRPFDKNQSRYDQQSYNTQHRQPFNKQQRAQPFDQQPLSQQQQPFNQQHTQQSFNHLQHMQPLNHSQQHAQSFNQPIQPPNPPVHTTPNTVQEAPSPQPLTSPDAHISQEKLLKIQLATTYAELEDKITNIEDDYEKLQEKRDLNIKELEKSVMSLNHLEKEEQRLIFKFNTLRLCKTLVYDDDEESFLSTKDSKTEPSAFNFYKTNIEEHEVYKDKLVDTLKERMNLRSSLKSQCSAKYIQAKRKWNVFVRNKENEEATEEFFASKRFHFEQQYGEKTIRLRKEKERTSEEEEEMDEDCVERYDENEAVVPGMEIFSDNLENRYQFICNNGYEEHPAKNHKEAQFYNHWHLHEEDMFVKLFLKYRKDFAKIASFFPSKSIKDVIDFYYLNKMSLGLKKKLKALDNSKGIKDLFLVKRDYHFMEDENEHVDIDDDDSHYKPTSVTRDKKMKKKEKQTKGKDSPRKTKSHWNDEEKKLFIENLPTYGKDWKQLSGIIKTKTESQVKNFFQNYRVKHNFNDLLPPDQRSKGKRGGGEFGK